MDGFLGNRKKIKHCKMGGGKQGIQKHCLKNECQGEVIRKDSKTTALLKPWVLDNLQ